MSAPITLITGASGGLGRELARIAAREGYDLVLVARRADALQELADELSAAHGTTCHVRVVDLAAPGAAASLWAGLVEDGLAVDVLVNNAGIGMLGSFTGHHTAALLGMAQLNVMALLELTHRAAQAMRDGGSGRILNMGSVASFQPGPGFAVYHATKGFVLALSDAVGAELRGTGVTVTTCCPGPTRTEFVDIAGAQRSNALERLLAEPVEVAESAWSGTMSGRSLVVPGIVNKVAAHGSRLLPRGLVTRMTGAVLARGH